MSNCEHYRVLLSGLLDNELTAEEGAHLNDHLIRCASCRADYEDLRRTGHRLEAISFVEVTDAMAASMWNMPFTRTVRNAALLLVVGGYLALMIYGFVMFLLDDGADLFGRIAFGAIVAGFLMLVGSLLIERIRTYRVDPYKEIER